MRPVTGGELGGPGRTGQPGVERVERSGREPGQAVGRTGGDRLDLSPGAIEIARLREALRALPDIRRARVSTLERLVAAGRYVVPAGDVAARMMEEARRRTRPPGE